MPAAPRPKRPDAGRPKLRSEDELLARPPEARRLLLARLRNGLTLEEASRRAGCSLFWLSEVERGKGPPSGALLERLNDVYGGLG